MRPTEVYRSKTPEEIRVEAAAEAKRAAEEKARIEALREDATTNWTSFEQGKPEYSVFDSANTPEAKAALEKRLDEDPIATRIGIRSWRLKDEPTLERIGRVLELGGKPLPGKVELGLFLDSTVFGEAARGIRSAWGERPLSGMPKPDLLDAELMLRKGQTWITVGHVEGDFYVMRDPLGGSQRISIPDLMAKSVRHGVLVIPIGCKTADAAVPLGFIKTIGTDKVQEFVRSLPLENPQVADLLAGLQTIGELRVGLRDFLDQLDIEVSQPGSTEQVTHVKIPYGAGATATQGPTINSAGVAFARSVEAEAEALLPWWQQKWWKELTSSPFTYIGLWLVFWFVTWLWRNDLKEKPPTAGSTALIGLLGIPTTITTVGAVLGGLALGLILIIAFPPLIFLVFLAGIIMNIIEFTEKNR